MGFSILAEEKGFEPLHPVTGLRDFESRLFDHLSTPPCAGLLYQQPWEKSSFFPVLFGNFQNRGHFLHDLAVIFPPMGAQAPGAVLDARVRIGKAAAAFIAEGIQGAVAEQAVEILLVSALMAWEIFTFPVLKKVVICHYFTSTQG